MHPAIQRFEEAGNDIARLYTNHGMEASAKQLREFVEETVEAINSIDGHERPVTGSTAEYDQLVYERRIAEAMGDDALYEAIDARIKAMEGSD